MKDFLWRNLGTALVGLPLLALAGCASDNCDYLAYETLPEEAQPLVLPEGASAPAERGELTIPRVATATGPVGTCMAKPPMTLPDEVLIDPEEREADDQAAPAEG